MLQPIISSLNSMRIVLASGSPRRKTILQNTGLKFEVYPSNFAEDIDKSLPPIDYVRETSKQKALEVSQRLRNEEGAPDLIISADTIVTMNDCIFEKPKDQKHAYDMLMSFSGNKHTVCTGVTFLYPTSSKVFKGSQCGEDESVCLTEFQEKTVVKMTTLTPEIIHSYIATGEPMDKAGGYGIQAIGASLVEGIQGDFYNVMGFPLHCFCKELVKIYIKQM